MNPKTIARKLHTPHFSCFTFCFTFYLIFNFRLDGAHVVFGKVVEGMDIVKQMERQGTQSGKTRQKIIIDKCGEVL